MDDIKIDRFSVTIPAGTESHRIERELEPITAEMNRTQLRVNLATWERNIAKMRAEAEQAVANCRMLAGDPTFRPNATKDCAKVFAARGHRIRRTKEGNDSVDQNALAVWAAKGDQLAKLTIAAREALSKLSQLKAWEPFARMGRVQPTWDQFGQPQGRYTAESPNLTNRIREIRETIEAPEGHQFISLDLGQAEYVTWASLSQDPFMCDAFATGKDFHSETAKALDAERPIGKMVNNAVLYGMTAPTLAERANVTAEQAEALLTAWATRAARAWAYKREIIEQFERTGKVATSFGRERTIKIQGLEGTARNEAIKTAWHHHNAGIAAELLKLRQINVVNALRAAGLPAVVGLNMFDEVILVARDADVERTKEIALQEFSRQDPGLLPFKIDRRVGRNWLAVSK